MYILFTIIIMLTYDQLSIKQISKKPFKVIFIRHLKYYQKSKTIILL